MGVTLRQAYEAGSGREISIVRGIRKEVMNRNTQSKPERR